MDGFASLQIGDVGDITADGYPYIEWYSKANGRVVLELNPDQLTVTPEDRQATDGPLGLEPASQQAERRLAKLTGQVSDD
jgi:hypothetical protein